MRLRCPNCHKALKPLHLQKDGMRYQISVIEPWEFPDHNDGSSRISGSVASVVDRSNVVFLAESPITYPQLSSRLLLLSSRYMGQDIYSNDIAEGVVTGSLLPPTDYINKDVPALIKDGIYILIGTLRFS
jgi:hypothetical protein